MSLIITLKVTMKKNLLHGKNILSCFLCNIVIKLNERCISELLPNKFVKSDLKVA